MFKQSEKVVAILSRPYGVAFDKSGKLVVSGWEGNAVYIFDDKYNKRAIIHGKEQPAGLALDNDGNIYVSSKHSLHKLTISGQLVSVGTEGKGDGEFGDPRGITVFEDQLYVCDRNNHRIQVFDLDLNFVTSIGEKGEEIGQIDAPYDVQFDTKGTMYVVELGNRRVQAFYKDGKSIAFGQERKGHIGLPTALHIVNSKVYVSDFADDKIVVYTTSGQFAGIVGSHGQGVGQLHSPYCMTSRNDKLLYVCDSANGRVQTFDIDNL